MVILPSFIPELSYEIAFTVVHKRHLQADLLVPALLFPSAGPNKDNITKNKIKSGNIFRVSAEP